MISIITNSWAPGTRKQYLPYVVKWNHYCADKNLDPVNAPVAVGAEFLAMLFRKSKLSYSAMGTARSALSAVIEPVNGIPFGKAPLIRRLLKGMFRERPVFPKYSITFDVNTVLNFLKLEGQTVTLKDLSYKTATMLCILSGQRAQTICAFNIDHLIMEADRCVFLINTVLKQTRPGFHQQPIEFLSFPDKGICPVELIKRYLEATQGIRKEEKQFFISFAEPFRAVKSATLARWIMTTLSNSGIDTSIFKSHSVRSASTSKALKLGMSIGDIGKAAGWSNVSTMFRTRYNKPIVDNICQTILKNTL